MEFQQKKIIYNRIWKNLELGNLTVEKRGLKGYIAVVLGWEVLALYCAFGDKKFFDRRYVIVAFLECGGSLVQSKQRDVALCQKWDSNG